MAASAETWQASVVVFNIPSDFTDADIKDAFGEAGTVVSVTPANETRRAIIVKFSSDEEADAAVEKMADTKLREEQEYGLRVRRALPPLERKSVPNCVFVRNLPFKTAREVVADLMGDLPGFDKVVMMRRGGSAHVYFNEEADVAAALAKSGTEVEGRTLTVLPSMRAVGKPKRSSRRGPRKGRSGSTAGAGAGAAGADGAAAPARAPRPSKKLRVNGLAEGTTGEDVKAFGEGAGEVTKVSVVDSTRGLHAYIVYADAEVAAAAVDALNGKALGGAEVEVSLSAPKRPRGNRRRRGSAAGAAAAPAAKAKPEPRPADPLRMWVGNLPAGADQQEVVEAFSQFGDVARFQRRKADDKYCFITFATAEGAEAAKEAGTFTFNGSELTVEASRGSSGRTGGRRKARPGRRAVPTAEAAAEGAAE